MKNSKGLSSIEELRRLRRHMNYNGAKIMSFIHLETAIMLHKQNKSLLFDKYMSINPDFYLLFLSPAIEEEN